MRLRRGTKEIAQKAQQVEVQAQQHADQHNSDMSNAVAEKRAALAVARKHAAHIVSGIAMHRSEVAARAAGASAEQLASIPSSSALEAAKAKIAEDAKHRAAVSATADDAKALEKHVEQQLKDAVTSSDVAAEQARKATEEKRKADAELSDELSSVGLSPMALHAGDSEELTQSLAEQRQTVDDIHVQRAQIESELDAAETKLVTAMTEASQDPERPEKQVAAEVAAVQHEFLEREDRMAAATESQVTKVEQTIRDRLKKSEVRTSLMNEQLQGNIGPKVVKLIGEKAVSALTAEDLAIAAREHEARVDTVKERIEQTERAIGPMVEKAEQLMEKAAGGVAKKNDVTEEATEAADKEGEVQEAKQEKAATGRAEEEDAAKENPEAVAAEMDQAADKAEQDAIAEKEQAEAAEEKDKEIAAAAEEKAKNAAEEVAKNAETAVVAPAAEEAAAEEEEAPVTDEAAAAAADEAEQDAIEEKAEEEAADEAAAAADEAVAPAEEEATAADEAATAAADEAVAPAEEEATAADEAATAAADEAVATAEEEAPAADEAAATDDEAPVAPVAPVEEEAPAAAATDDEATAAEVPV